MPQPPPPIQQTQFQSSQYATQFTPFQPQSQQTYQAPTYPLETKAMSNLVNELKFKSEIGSTKASQSPAISYPL